MFNYMDLLREIRDNYESEITAIQLAAEAIQYIPQDQWLEVFIDVMKYPANIVLGEGNREVRSFAAEIRKLPPEERRTRLAMFKEVKRRRLMDIYTVQTGDGSGSTLLRDATPDILEKSIAMNSKKGLALIEKVRREKKLLDLCRRLKVNTIGECPDELVEEILLAEIDTSDITV